MSAQRQELPRAYRFTFTAPVLYRRAGRRAWAEGVSVNMSRTGLLFATMRDVYEQLARVEFRVQLPSLEGARGCEVRCEGHVARSMPSRFAGEPGAMAVAIDRYLLSPGIQLPATPRNATPIGRDWKQ